MSRSPGPSTALLLVGAVGLLLLATPAAAVTGAHGAVRQSEVLPLARSEPARADHVDGADDPYAVALLASAARAAEQTSYSGTRMVSTWGRQGATTVQLGVTHVAGQGTLVAVRGSGSASGPDGAAFVASGDGRVGPSERVVDSVALLARGYRLTSAGEQPVLGRRAEVVVVSRGATPAARLWVDSATGLPLRRELYDAHGRLAQVSVFLDLHVDESAFIAHLPPSPPRSDPATDGSASAGPAAGCPSTVGPLQLVSEEYVGESRARHLAYSDGLSRVSVFAQQGRLADAGLEGYRHADVGGRRVYLREGLPNYAVWESSGTVYTVVSDAPLDTLGRVVAAYPPPVRLDTWTRVGMGLVRLAAWVSPAA